MAYDNTNSGMLARNERRMNDRQPEYSGSINVDGVEYWISAWVKEGKPGGKMEGKKFFSLALTPKDQGGNRQASRSVGQRSQSGDGFDNMDDDIPFD